MGFFSRIREVKADPVIGFSRLLQVPSNVRNLFGRHHPEDNQDSPEMVAEILVADGRLLDGCAVEVHVAVPDVVYGECLPVGGV